MGDIYVASSTANVSVALESENVISACYYGPSPLDDAKSYARDYTETEGKPSYVYRVTLSPAYKYEIRKEVVGSAYTL